MGNFKQTKKILKMRTAALAIFAATANALTEAEQQIECNGYLWGIQQKGWTCAVDAADAKKFTCTNPDTALNATADKVDSTSAAWVEACVTDLGDKLAPKAIVGT